VDAVAREIERAGSLRALIDARETAEHTLVRIEPVAENEIPLPDVVRAAADPDEPMLFDSSDASLLPPIDAANGRSPLRIRVVTAVVLAAAVASTSFALIGQPEFHAVQEALEAFPGMPSTFGIGLGIFLLANFALIPLSLMAIVAGVLFGALRGALVALVGSLIVAVVGYVAGRMIGPARLARWMSRRSYRSGRQMGTRGVVGVLVLRLASVASAESSHLLCGASRVPFTTYMAGTAIGLAPVVSALTGLGALVRYTLLNPSVANWSITIGAALLLIALAVVLRAFLLTRQFAPSVSHHRNRAEFG
jgi:uncharacterized membrane protein YdjX (TVP38/TMEM64 family)